MTEPELCLIFFVATSTTSSTTVDGYGLLTTAMSPDEGQASSSTIVAMTTSLIAIAILLIIPVACIVAHRRKCNKREQSSSEEARYIANDNPVFGSDQSDRRSSTSSYASCTAHDNNVEVSTTQVYEVLPEDSIELGSQEQHKEEPDNTNNDDYLEILL